MLKTVVPLAGVADELVEYPRLADGRRGTGDQVKQTPAPDNGIPAINVTARIFKEMGVGMKRDIDDAVAVFGGKADDVGEQHQPIPEPAGSQSDDENFIISRPHGFLK